MKNPNDLLLESFEVQVKAFNQLNKYFVYVCPGWIEYFDNLKDAVEFANNFDAKVQEVEK